MISFDFASEQVFIGRRAVPATLSGENGNVQLYPPLGPVLRSLSVLEREQCLRNARSGPLPLQATMLSKEALIRATVEPDQRDQATDQDRIFFKAIAMHLAGADIKAPPFTRALALLSRELGWSAEDIWSSPAAQFDQIAASLMPQQTSDWNQLIMAGSPDDEIDRLVEKMASDLLQRFMVADETIDKQLLTIKTPTSHNATDAQLPSETSKDKDLPQAKTRTSRALNDASDKTENIPLESDRASKKTENTAHFKRQDQTGTQTNSRPKKDADKQPRTEPEMHPLSIKKLDPGENFSQGITNESGIETRPADFPLSSDLTANSLEKEKNEPDTRRAHASDGGSKKSRPELDLKIQPHLDSERVDTGVSAAIPDNNLLKFPDSQITPSRYKKSDSLINHPLSRERNASEGLNNYSYKAIENLATFFETEEKSIAEEIAELLTQEADLRGID